MQLDTVAGENQTKACVENLCTELSQFNSDKAALPFNYPFNTTHSFRSQRLTIENSLAETRRNGTQSVIKAHHLNVRFEGLLQFDEKLSASLKAYIDTIASPNSQDWEELNDLLANISNQDKEKPSEITELRKIVDTESLPRLLRDVKIDYLEYLRNECAKTNLSKTNALGFECLETLIARLKAFSNYINNPELDGPHYEVSYLKETLDLRTAFSQANAFDMLPIIPDYEGVIGESIDKDRGIKEFNLGLRLKLNGAVNAYNEDSALDYYMTEIDPNSQRHKEQLNDPARAKNFKIKVLKIACLYYFIFAVDENGKIPDKSYNPIEKFEKDVLSKLKSDAIDDAKATDTQVKDLLCKIKNLILNQNDWQVISKVNALKSLLKTFLNQKEILEPFSKFVQIFINKSLLKKTPAKILNSRSFFSLDLNQEDQSKAKEKTREALAYIEVKPPEVNPESLTSLAVTFTFDDIRYFPDGEQQEFAMKHDIFGIKAMPVVFAPQQVKYTTNNQGVTTEEWDYHPIYKQYFNNKKVIIIPYRYQNLRENIFNKIQSPEARIYRQVFTILTYLCLSICREQIADKLFIPIFRFHFSDITDTTEDEDFLNSLTKALAHILRRDCLADAQGLNIKKFGMPDESFKFRVQQALSSMYSLVPKKFKFQSGYEPQLDKLAIIVVSSWLSDAVWDEKDRDTRKSNIYGEIILINKVSDTVIKIEPFKTFSDNEKHYRMYKEPTIVSDEITKLYQQDYRHILYIAKAPYTRSLGLTQFESDPESLFFMSQDVIKYLKQGKPDIKLYPVFMDTYPAINLTSGKIDSFYIPDIEELEKLSVDKSQKTRVFLNLFTGRSVDKKRTIFNSVVCYSTLLNIYDPSDTKDIMMGLLDKDSTLQQTILQYITLFHFSRYEVNRNIAFKLNPYSKLIGDEGIGTVSTFTYTNRNVKFNNLAFLTSIRSALYDKK
ncbi:hypothetical protein IQ264_05430 [Phormidium sp. LEGE 05292]|uniref:hypothetical protein n=1 Tax=[Phormidium] sp. LEGE 05292 TaxID=767427 RepID=UPI0018830C04|nr:hypothetical protein [Phormidium sp. LEGE 05292]MBE9224907.1 hypothetical protein [Phormidium sp. LEGE 05292]